MRTQQEEIEILIRARYPLIYLVTWEEERAETLLSGVAARLGKDMLVWSSTKGLCDMAGASEPGTADPKAALDSVGRSDRRALFVFKDLHPHLQDAAVLRRLRDLVRSLKSSYKTLVLLSPQLTVPVELEKDITVMDYDLPGPEDLRAVLAQIAAASDGGARFKVDLTPDDEDRLVQAALGMTISEAENALARAIVVDADLKGHDVEVLLEEKKQIIRKSRLLEYYEAREEFAAVGGLEVLKDWASKRGRAFSRKARDFGLPQPRGLLLLGVQGCGKSLSCKALASLWRVPLLRLDMGSIFGGFVGQSEENMRRAIKTAESIAPCILWLDEIEKGLSGTQSSGASDAGTTARVFSTFLTWLQEKTKPVFVAATANNIQILPPELLRKGRMDEIFFVDLPTPPERAHIFSIHIKKKKRDPAAFQLDALAAASEGFSGAEIEQVVVDALFEAFHQGRDLTQSDVETALRATVPLSKTMREDIASLRAWAATRARPASRPS